jgi:D-alanyl-D-alanine carboxypeptidase
MPAYDDALFASQPVVEALTGALAPKQGPSLAATTPWVTMPGSGFQYSNSGYVVLGLMVQHVRGQALHQVLRTDIIEPLHLDGTQLMAPGPAPATMVHGYITMDGKRQDTTYHRGLIGNAAGGLVSTVGDVNTFYAALLEGRLLKPDTVKAMLLAPEGYGLGIWRWEDGCTDGFYYGHPGDLPGYGTLALSSPDARRQVTISITYPPEPATVSTDAPSNPLAWEIRRIARKALDSSC